MTEIEAKEEFTIRSIYNKKGWKEIEERIEKILEVREGNEENIIIGDFNIRIGELGGIEMKEGGMKRKSKDKITSGEGKKFVEWIQEKGWHVCNGATEGDWEGEYTYVGIQGNTVIDYVIGNEKVINRIKNFRIGDRVDSDHLPLTMRIRRKEETKRKSKRIKRRTEMKMIVNG